MIISITGMEANQVMVAEVFGNGMAVSVLTNKLK